MYRVNEVLTMEERLAAIQLGMITKLASMGIGPSEFVRMTKSAEDKGDILKSMLLLSLGVGIPLGVASYAVQSGLKPKKKSNLEYKQRLDAYNDVVAQYAAQADAEKEKEDADFDQEKVAYSPILGGAAAGLLGGGSIAAIQALISDYIEAKRQKKRDEERHSNDVSPDTVVLYLNKNNAKNDSGYKYAEAGRDQKVKVEPGVKSMEVRYGAYAQPREANGRYLSGRKPDSEIEKKAVGRAWDNGLWLASAVASAPVGYMIVRKIGDRIEEKRLKAQVEAAQKEYVGLLSGEGDEKVAEAFFDAIGSNVLSRMEKDAQSNDGSTAVGRVAGRLIGRPLDEASANSPGVRAGENFLSIGIASAILSALASAYVTNRAMHKNYDPPEEEDEEKEPTVKRVLFKGAESTYEITPEQALVTISVLRDCLRDSVPLERIEKKAGFKSWVDRNMAWAPDVIKGTAAERWLVNSGMGITEDKVKEELRNYEAAAAAGKQFTPEQKGFVYNLVKNNPDKWLSVMGTDEFDNLRKLSVESWLGRQNGWLGSLSRMPVLGPIVKWMANLYTRNTASGRRKVALEALVERGMSRDEAAKALEHYDFTGKGSGWRLKSEYAHLGQPGKPAPAQPVAKQDPPQTPAAKTAPLDPSATAPAERPVVQTGPAPAQGGNGGSQVLPATPAKPAPGQQVVVDQNGQRKVI